MSWSIRITILYVAFVVLILTLVYKATNTKVELVSEDYYQQELAFQNQIDRSQNSTTLSVQPSVVPGANGVEVRFPGEIPADSISGKILFLRPSDSKLDREIPLEHVSSAYIIPNDAFKPGLYQVKMTWSAAGKNYFNEYSVYMP